METKIEAGSEVWAVFPAEDCWPTREAAHAALAEEGSPR